MCVCKMFDYVIIVSRLIELCQNLFTFIIRFDDWLLLGHIFQCITDYYMGIYFSVQLTEWMANWFSCCTHTSCRERTSISHTNIGTISNAMLGKLLRVGMEHMWANWTELTWTDTSCLNPLKHVGKKRRKKIQVTVQCLSDGGSKIWIMLIILLSD